MHHLAGSGPPKTPAREIDQGIFHSSRKICARDPFRDWWPTTWPDRGSGSRNVDREKKGEQRSKFSEKERTSCLFSFKPSESTFAPLVAGILQCTWERFSPVAVLPCLWHSAPSSPIISGKEFVPSSGSKKSALFWAVTMFCHSTFLIRDKALGQLR